MVFAIDYMIAVISWASTIIIIITIWDSNHSYHFHYQYIIIFIITVIIVISRESRETNIKLLKSCSPDLYINK